MKIETIEQYKILEYLKNNMNINCFKIEIIDRNTIKVTDRNNETLNFKYNNETKSVEYF